MHPHGMRSEHWEERYRERITSAVTAMSLIKPGNSVFIGTGCGEPQHLVKAMTDRAAQMHDVHVIHLLTKGVASYVDERFAEHFKMNTFFIAENVRAALARGVGDYTPIFLSEIPAEFEEGRLPVDVALVMVTPPDSRGLCSLGVSVDIVKSAVANARYVVAQVNSKMPWTLGNSFVHVNQIDAFVPFEEPLIESPAAKALSEPLRRIGENVARLVEDGSTIEIGIGDVPQVVAQCLRDRKDLGIHTEMFSDWVVDLIECGAVTGAKKTINRGKVVASFCMGSQRLYDYIDDNALFEFHPTEYVNDPLVIAQHDRMVAINVGLEIDLTGQVCADSIGHQFYSGVGGQVDFTRGAARSRGGKAIIAMLSTARNGTVSRIVPNLTEGAGVVTTRADVHYVVTEYGVAYLHGKSIRERAMSLINLAHPSFRNELIQQAKRRRYIYEDQIELAWENIRYPEDLERREALRDGTEIFFRAVKPTDEPKLRDMLYSLSAESVHRRFFTYTINFPHRDIQQLTNIDYQLALAIVGLVPGTVEDEMVAIAQYFLDPRTNSAEVAFIVQDDWQARGMGSSLMRYLTEIAIRRGIKKFHAKTLPTNRAMLAVFENSGLPMTLEFDEDACTIVMDLQKIRMDLGSHRPTPPWKAEAGPSSP